jgi:alpha-L-fucosidase
VIEDIRQGERVREFVVEGRSEGAWKELCKGQSIGHKRIDRFAPIDVSEVRLRVTRAAAPPVIQRLAVFDVAATRE